MIPSRLNRLPVTSSVFAPPDEEIVIEGDTVNIAESVSVVLTPGSSDWVVTNAGTANANGSYNQAGTNDGVDYFENENGFFLYRGTTANVWRIDSVLNAAASDYEDNFSAGDPTPTAGAYAVFNGTPPDADVAEG